ncbi:hypothetical protein [Pleionea sediminis]|uniref:hypothetical protein n=1 Tax=Pleionea sediminis TaxID=2569479 RepID=UPI0011849DFA|nr:hypothetical protein [Pleionea sediminis]
MIKALGLIICLSFAFFFIYLGVEREQYDAVWLGVGILVFTVIISICIKLFPKQLDSKESGEELKEVLKHTVKQGFKDIE